MATDYGAPELVEGGGASDAMRRARPTTTTTALVNEADPFETELDLGSTALSDEDLTVWLLPRQVDAFTWHPLVRRAPPQPAG